MNRVEKYAKEMEGELCQHGDCPNIGVEAFSIAQERFIIWACEECSPCAEALQQGAIDIIGYDADGYFVLMLDADETAAEYLH